MCHTKTGEMAMDGEDPEISWIFDVVTCCDTQVWSHLILDPSLYSLSHVVRYQKLNWKFGVSDSGWSWCIFVHVPITSRYVPPCLGSLGPQWWPGRRACVLDILRSQFVSLGGTGICGCYDLLCHGKCDLNYNPLELCTRLWSSQCMWCQEDTGKQ